MWVELAITSVFLMESIADYRLRLQEEMMLISAAITLWNVLL